MLKIVAILLSMQLLFPAKIFAAPYFWIDGSEYIQFGREYAISLYINTDGSTANPSSMLHVQSETSGVLIPRMTITQRDAITDPAEGLLVFCTDDSSFYMNEGDEASPNWKRVNSFWLQNQSRHGLQTSALPIHQKGLSQPFLCWYDRSWQRI